MTLSLECQKLKRTGFFPAIFMGGIVAALFPLLNTAVRPEMFISQPLPALDVLMNANSSMMAMLNLCLATIGACILYYVEFSGNGMQKMESLPVQMGGIFWSKTFLLAAALLGAIIIEHVSLAFCVIHWFPAQENLAAELFKNLEYSFALMIPSAVILMIISSLCRNIWISLGTGIICIFAASMLPTDDRILSLFPFSLPFQTLESAPDSDWVFFMLIGCAIEVALAAIAETVILKLRRHFA